MGGTWAHGMFWRAGCPGWRRHPFSGLQAAPGALLGQGVVLTSAPPGAAVFREVAQSLDIRASLVLFPEQISDMSRAGTPGHLCLASGTVSDAWEMQSPRGWCMVTLRSPGRVSSLSKHPAGLPGASMRSCILMKTLHWRDTSSGYNLGDGSGEGGRTRSQNGAEWKMAPRPQAAGLGGDVAPRGTAHREGRWFRPGRHPL